jgi:hypothetical protein
MDQNVALLVAAASGVFALLGSLGSQVISAIASMKAKRMELVYSRKVEAYKDLIQKAVAFFDDATNADKFLEFHRTCLATITVASDEVFAALAYQDKGILGIAFKMRNPNNQEEKKKLRASYETKLNELALGMRKDLRRFSGK